MKRVVCIALALMLCLSAAAVAESVPSKTTVDLTKFEVTAEYLPQDANLFLHPVNEPTVGDALAEYEEHLAICQAEIEKLSASESIETYFGQVKDIDGQIVSLKELLETEELNVFEFCPAVAGGYQAAYGKVTATMLFSTPYEKDEKVVLMIGLVTVNADGTQTVEWYAFEGIGLGAVEGQEETEGRIRVELSAEIVEAIQNGTALLAMVSK
ncbi:MAG: hypothetical protein Q4G52_10605 [Clostridia bacterium]|nr:hypothetical protein [Clostridia bacterium]